MKVSIPTFLASQKKNIRVFLHVFPKFHQGFGTRSHCLQSDRIGRQDLDGKYQQKAAAKTCQLTR